MIVLALLLQAAASAPAPTTRVTAAPPERFSILASECPAPAGSDVVVCGTTVAERQRVPLSSEMVPDHPVPSNPYRTGVGALAAEPTPCAALQGGCQVGFGPPIVPMIAAAVRGIKGAAQGAREARARARDGNRRVPIDLSPTPAGAPAGRLEP